MIELYHHGILGQEWGKRNGPPYPLSGGDYSRDEVREIYKRRKNKNSIYNKKHFDRVLKADKDTLSTLSYNGVLDTNDALYGAFKAESPVIIFNMKNVIPDKIKQTTTGSKRVSQAVLVGRKVLGV